MFCQSERDHDSSDDDDDDYDYWLVALAAEAEGALVGEQPRQKKRRVTRRNRDLDRLPNPMLSAWGLLLKDE